MRRLVVSMLASLVLIPGSSVWGQPVDKGPEQAYPNKIIRVINPNQPGGNTPEQHAAYIKAEIEKWQKVASHAGITPE